VHVPLRRDQVLVSGQFLDSPGRCSEHRQVRTERVAQHVRTVVVEARLLRRPTDEPLNHTFGQWSPIVLIQHQRSAKVPIILQCRRETVGQRHVPKPAASR